MILRPVPNYQGLLLQKMPYTTLSGEQVTPESTFNDTFSDFGFALVLGKYGGVCTVKDVPSNDWGDEDGADEWVPSESGLPLKDFNIEFNLCYASDRYADEDPVTHTRLTATDLELRLLRYLTGRDGSGVNLMIFTEPLNEGYRNVRFVGCKRDYYHKDNNNEVLVLQVTVKVCDPLNCVVKNAGGTALVVN